MRYISDAVGLGVFAAKPFAAGERIMVERAIPTELLLPESRCVGTSLLYAVMDLASMSTDSLAQKPNTNAISLGPSGPSTSGGICVRMSRVNHRCDNNADHYFARHTGRTNGVCSLFGTLAIRANEEIFISYVDYLCSGRTIESDVYKRNVRRANELDASIIVLGSQGEGRKALEAAGTVRRNGRGLRWRVQAHLLRRTSGRGHVQMHHRGSAGVHQIGKGNGPADGIRFRGMLTDPSCHRNYMMGSLACRIAEIILCSPNEELRGPLGGVRPSLTPGGKKRGVVTDPLARVVQ